VLAVKGTAVQTFRPRKAKPNMFGLFVVHVMGVNKLATQACNTPAILCTLSLLVKTPFHQKRKKEKKKKKKKKKLLGQLTLLVKPQATEEMLSL
jgi:membrane protein implicated in regulation of membrane protease activity